ncbi:MAG TPA: ABC transporter permease [Terriglobales bacterium]|nr:ABC transporter permease [Terriglobales bacterium]
MRVLASRCLGLFRRNHFDHAMDEEFHSHLEMLVDHFASQGMTRDEALLAAKRQFGGVTQIEEDLRERSSLAFVESLWADARYALRQMRKSPAFTATAVLTLALGIGANTAIFTLIDALMLRMVPVEHPQELYEVQFRAPQGGQPRDSITNALWENLRARQNVFSQVASWGRDEFNLAPGGAIQRANGVWVSGEYFSMLGVAPAVGRLITTADDQPGCADVAVLSYDFWQRHYGGVAAAVGSTLALNGHPFTVIGVSAPGFYGLNVGSKFEVAAPNCSTRLLDGDRPRLAERSYWWLRVVGRIKPGVTPQQLSARLAAVSPQVWEAALPQDWDKDAQNNFRHRTFFAVPAATGLSDLRQDFGQPLAVLMAVVAVVLLIACANVAALMLARATAQQREIAVRMALGASRLRLIRYLLTHAMLLSAAGAAAGLLIAKWGTTILVTTLTTRGRTVFLNLSLDWRVLAFTSGIALATAMLFGILPAFRLTRLPLTAAMHGASAGRTERISPLRRWIAAAQIALSLVLLVTAGLFLRSFTKLIQLDPGFDRHNVLLVNVDLRSTNLKSDQYIATFDAIQYQLRALPGVAAVSRSRLTPLQGGNWDTLVFADSDTGMKAHDDTFLNAVTPGYFAILRTPLLSGRDFSAQDRTGAQRVAIVNQTFAQQSFPGQDPIGHILRMSQPDGTKGPPIQVIGVAADAKYNDLREPMKPTVYLSVAQLTAQQSTKNSFELRTTLPLATMRSAIEAAIAGVSREVPLEFYTLSEQVDDTLVQERLLAMLSGFFGAVALLLAMIGLYGVLSYLVTQRQTEFGIRMALGAKPSSILRLVMNDTFAMLTGGIVVGVGLSLATVQLLQKMLFGLSPHDATTMLIAIGVLAGVGLLAGFLPARRATRVDPMVALRYE